MSLQFLSRVSTLTRDIDIGTVSVRPSIHHVRIWRYLVSFARYRKLLLENREIFILHLYLAPPKGVTSSEFRKKKFDAHKIRMIGIPCGKETMTIC